jgi:hypothetical protein
MRSLVAAAFLLLLVPSVTASDYPVAAGADDGGPYVIVHDSWTPGAGWYGGEKTYLLPFICDILPCSG